MTDSEPIPGAVSGGIESPQPVSAAPETTNQLRPLVREYETRARELPIKPVQNGDWLVIDGVEYFRLGGEKGIFPASTDEATFPTRLSQVGTYDSNNDTLAFVDGQGVMRIGHLTEENLAALEKAGYRRGEIWVPFSNGENPTDPTLKRRYLELREKGREANKQRNIREHLKIYGDIAERRGIKPVKGGLFMMVDGVEYRYLGNETGRVDLNTDGDNMAISRVDQVGTYDSNNGIIAFVDGQGKMWVGASTAENWRALIQAGYKSGGIWVPFSNGEMPTNRATYEQLRDVLTGKPAEQLIAERTARVEEIISERRRLFGDTAVIPDKDALYIKVADRAEGDYVDIEGLVRERLRPKVERDNAGFERKVFTLNGVTFSFKGREELPIYATLTSSRSIFLGEAPNWVEPEDFQKYQEQLRLTQTQKSAPEHFVVNKTLMGVVELAIKLGSKDTTLSQLREELAEGVYSPRSLLLIDALFALNYVDFTGFGSKPSSNAEAVVLLSLLGDPQAQSAVSEAVETLRRHERSKQVREERAKSSGESLRPQDLCVVHATRYEPESTEDGEFLVKTTFDATGGKVLRNTVHTALNHKVAGHMYGSWADAGYVVISPFESMIRKNGVPTVLNTVDTYWATNPGEPLIFADGTLVAPGGGEIEGLFEEEGNIVKFKSEGLDVQDLVSLSEYARRNGYLYDFSRSIDLAVSGALHPYGSAMELGEQWDFAVTQKAINQFLYHDDNNWGHQPALLGFITAETEGQAPTDIETRLKNLILDSGAVSGLRPEVQDREMAIATLAKTLADKIRLAMFMEINELTVREVIRKRGFAVKPGGMWAWGDSWSVTRQTELLGEELGVPVGAHRYMVDHELTERFMVAVHRATEGEQGKSRFNWTKFEAEFDDLVPLIDQKSRRVLYASGLLIARG
ncbi:hypothetical protein KBI33_01160 [Candidatus Shapirobacteria bacterium]|nr:hypothetical protein [Candidatus Shapirobacteria bacterium]